MDGAEYGASGQTQGSPQPSRVRIKERSRAAFKAQYGTSVLITLIILIIGAAASPTVWQGGGNSVSILSACIPPIVALLVIPVLNVGQAASFLRIYRGDEVQVGDLFIGFSDYARNLAGMLWAYLFVFLWSLLLIVPGIVKAIAYSFAPYLLKEYPGIAPTDAIKISMKMTQGHKGELFVMYLSFIGWWLLSALTFGLLGLLYVGPYYMTSVSGLYEEYKDVALSTGAVTAAELG